MPPVADEPTPFARTLRRLLDEKTGGITSLRHFAKTLAGDKGTTVDSERSAILRHLKDEVTPTEPTVAAYAKAFGVPPETFPPVEPPVPKNLSRAIQARGRANALAAQVDEALRRAEASGTAVLTTEQSREIREELDALERDLGELEQSLGGKQPQPAPTPHNATSGSAI